MKFKLKARASNPARHWEPGDHLPENCFGNQVFPSLSAVVDQLCLELKHLEQNPELLRSMTGFDWINTLHLTLN